MKINYFIILTLIIVACDNQEEQKEKRFTDELLEVSERLNPTQIFKINPNADTTISGAKGTEIFISANSFKFNNEEPVTESITINLKEVYDQSDMILNNLTTTSNGRLLESSGMINLTASSEGKELKLQNESTVKIRFKKVTDAPYMRSFIGIEDSTGINWEIDENIVDTLTFTYIEESIIVLEYGPDSVMSTTINYGVVGRDTFEISRLNSYDLYDSSVPLPPPYYEVNSSKLNWINCDYFINSDSVITVYIKTPTDINTRDYVVFKNLNSIMPAWEYSKDSLKIIYNVPYNNEVTFISIGKTNNDYHLATKTKKLNKNKEIIDLKYKKVSLEKLTKELKKLD